MALYQRLRDSGCRHWDAVERIAHELDVDRPTAVRVVERAHADLRRFG